MKNHYIQAILEMIQTGTDSEKVFNGLQKTMQAKGHMRLYAPVLRGVLRVLETKKDTDTATVIVTKDSDIQKYSEVIKQTLSEVKAGNDFSTKVDDTIIGGVIIKNNNTIVDLSYKTTLLNLYRATTK